MAAPALPYNSRRSPPNAEADSMVGSFKKLESIGKGSFAMVYRGIHVRKRSLVAIKSVQLSKLNKKLKENLMAEIRILRSLHHPHIVALIDCQESTTHMHLVMEFCELGDLSAFIKKRTSLSEHPTTAEMMRKYPNPAVGGLNEVIVRHFAKQIASALEFMRAKNYIHRDLKPQNLLLNPSPLFYARYKPETMPLAVDENSLVPAAGIESLPMLKIADFGFARVLPQTSLAETLCGSPLYMAPEILRYEKYDASADLWSVGTVLHEMMVGKPPFRANNHVELLRRIEKQDDRIKFPEGLEISTDMKKLIRGLLKRKPVERMGYQTFFEHPVIRDEIPGLVGDDRAPELEPEISTMSRRMQKQPVSSENVQEAAESPYSQSPRERTVISGTPPSRPSSRPVPTSYHSGTPPRISSTPRYNNTPVAQNDPAVPASRERRPTFTSHATAPPRQAVVQERNPVPAAVAMERRSSRNTPSPSSLTSRDQERISQRAEERAIREARERVAQDIAFERDYVLVEKRTVEINALADELAASPHAYRDRPSSPQHTAMVRRATTQGSPTSTTGAYASPSRAIQIVNRARPDSLHQRTGSFERRYGSFNSASSALSKAMNMVSLRGFGISPPLASLGKGPSPPHPYGAFPVYPTAQSSLMLIGDGAKGPGSQDEDAKILSVVEELAQRSHVVYGFAEVKYKQLLPAPPSDQGLGIAEGKHQTDAETLEEDDDDLTLEAVLAISEEALVLYVKALSILSRSMDITASWWSRQQRTELAAEGTSTRFGTPHIQPSTKNRMVNVVQWVRSRFNECCDKAEFVARKLLESQKQLPLDHPSHPNNRPSESGSATSIGSAENIYLTSGITAEKLMYDRAIEMSRAAAVNELVGEDLPGCELNYMTALRMLEAILEADEDSPSRSSKKDARPDDLINGLEAEDRQSVIKLAESMRTRLKALKKKIEIQKASKRTSITAVPSAPSSARPSPSSTPSQAIIQAR